MDQLTEMSITHENISKEAKFEMRIGKFLLRSHEPSDRPENHLSEQRWTHALDAAKLAVWEINRADQKCFFSDLFCRQLGRQPNTLNPDHRSWQTIMHPDDIEKMTKILDDVFYHDVMAFECEYRMRHTDGRWIWMLGRGKPIACDFGKKPNRIVISQSDVSDQKRLETSLRDAENRANYALENADQALWDLNFQTGKTFYSKAWKSMLGYDDDDIGSEPDAWEEMIHPDDLKRVLEADEAHKNGLTPAFREEFRMRRKDGSWTWVLDRANVTERAEDGTPLRMIGTHTDISQRKAVQAEFQEAKEIAEAAAGAKSDFLANMSHELRTPLSSIIAITELLIRDISNDLDEQHRSILEMQREAGQTLLAIVNDVLDFSKLDADNLQIEKTPFDLRQLMDSCLSLVSYASNAKMISVRISHDNDLPKLVRGDPLRLRQILTNLLSNAIKFTPDHGVVTLGAKQFQSDMIEFTVEDTGIGISKDQITCLFDRFTQADTSTTRRYGGSGLGLAICKRLVELMGGEIGVESTPGTGSLFTFTVELPQTQARPRGIPTSRKTSDLTGTRILLAEDNPVNRRLIKMALERAQCEVYAVENGLAAVEAVREAGEDHFDVVLMDLQMPRMDGLEATKEIRNSLNYQNLPIVALTANVFGGQPGDVKATGMNAWLTKPVDWPELFETISNFKSRGSRTETEAQAHHPLSQPLPAPDCPTATSPADSPPDEGPVKEPKAPAIDTDKIDELGSMLGPEEVKRLILLFQEELNERSRTMLVPKTDTKVIAREAHTLSSAAGSMGCQNVYKICRHIMSAAEQGPAELPVLLQGLKSATIDANEALAAQLNTL